MSALLLRMPGKALPVKYQLPARRDNPRETIAGYPSSDTGCGSLVPRKSDQEAIILPNRLHDEYIWD